MHVLLAGGGDVGGDAGLLLEGITVVFLRVVLTRVIQVPKQ